MCIVKRFYGERVDKEREGDKERERGRERDRERGREKERANERKRGRERKKEREILYFKLRQLKLILIKVYPF